MTFYEDDLALAIHDNLLGDTPTDNFDIRKTGMYARQLSMIQQARKIGKEQALNVVETIKLRPDSELAQLLKKREEVEQKESVGILLSNVRPEPIHWLWPGRLALRKLHILDGDPGLGKTTIVFDLIARLTRGSNMPDELSSVQAGGAVLICLEDGLEDTIQPRLDRAGADLSKIVSISYLREATAEGIEYDRPFSLGDLSILERAIKRVNAKIVLIDPIMAILGGKDTYKDNEVRAALTPLKALAEKHNVCIVMRRHINKSANEKLIYQGGGSIGFIGLARIGLMVVRNPENEEQCILANIKNNLCLPAPKLLYRVVSDIGSKDERPYVKWEGVTTITDQELTTRPTNVTGEGRQEIIKALKKCYPDAMTPTQIAELLEMSEDNAKQTLRRMAEKGQIKKVARGKYAAISGI